MYFFLDIDSDVIMSMKQTSKVPSSTALTFNFTDEEDENDDDIKE